MLSFTIGNQIGIMKINGNNIEYGKMFGGNMVFMPIEKLKFDYAGIIKEFPDLKDKPEQEAHTIAHERFKDKVKNMNSESEVCEYVISEIRKFGGIPQYKQRAGFRKEKIE